MASLVSENIKTGPEFKFHNTFQLLSFDMDEPQRNLKYLLREEVFQKVQERALQLIHNNSSLTFAELLTSPT